MYNNICSKSSLFLIKLLDFFRYICYKRLNTIKVAKTMFYNDLFKQALSCFDNGDFDSAEHALRQILQTTPDNPEVLNLLGLIAQAKGLHKEACSYFSAALLQRPDTASYHYNLGFSLKAINEYSDALLNFNQVLKLSPQIKETYNEIACIYNEIGDINKAREYWQEALSLDTSYITAKINLAYSYCNDNISKAENLLLEISQSNPEEVLVFYDLAWLKYTKKEYQSALIFAHKADQLASSSDNIKYLIGLIYLKLEQKDKAKDNFLLAETINPNNYEAKLCLADILSQTNDFEEAEKRYRRLIELNNKRFETHNNYAEMLHRQKRLAEALEEYRQAVILFPQSAEISNNLGSVLKELKEYDKAADLFFNALCCNSSLIEASINLSETLILISGIDEKKALKIAENWLKKFPDNQFAHYIYASFKGEYVENNQNIIENLFDNFADNYELVMQNLDYSAPLAIRRIAGNMDGRIADLGCGSGLAGMAVKTDRNQLIGVDLSAKMLEVAASKHIYDELIKTDIFDFLKTRSDFDWIIASDVLGYIQSAEQFIALCQGKKLIFSIENFAGEQISQVQKNGRIQHNPSYITTLLKQYSFSNITQENIILRQENGEPVSGSIFKAI